MQALREMLTRLRVEGEQLVREADRFEKRGELDLVVMLLSEAMGVARTLYLAGEFMLARKINPVLGQAAIEKGHAAYETLAARRDKVIEDEFTKAPATPADAAPSPPPADTPRPVEGKAPLSPAAEMAERELREAENPT